MVNRPTLQSLQSIIDAMSDLADECVDLLAKKGVDALMLDTKTVGDQPAKDTDRSSE